MEKNQKAVQVVKCLNCGAIVKGNFCNQCGQRLRDNLDRSLGRLLGEFFSTLFLVDNRFFLSVYYLIWFPGRMTIQFLAGKRKKFISPITLFLFFNVIYFFFSPLSDYSLSLYDQAYSQPYSEWVRDWIDLKLQNIGQDMGTYGVTYQNASDQVSKAIMIINIPIIAIFVFLMARKKRKYYFDSLIYAFHFFTFFMISWVMLGWASKLIDLLSNDLAELLSPADFFLFTFILPFIYAILSIKKFINLPWYWAIPAGLGVLFSVAFTNVIYRFIILITILLFT